MEMTEDNRSTHTKTCPSTTLSNINPTGTDLLASSDLCGERPTTNRLRRGTPRPVQIYVRGGADKSLARPGRKQATATKLGIYSTYSP